MRFKENDKVRVTLPEFEKAFSGKNEWVIDHIKTQAGNYPSLYICYNSYDKHKMFYFFTEEQVEKIDQSFILPFIIIVKIALANYKACAIFYVTDNSKMTQVAEG